MNKREEANSKESCTSIPDSSKDRNETSEHERLVALLIKAAVTATHSRESFLCEYTGLDLDSSSAFRRLFGFRFGDGILRRLLPRVSLARPVLHSPAWPLDIVLPA